ncbi:iron complex transporter ATP-binding protein [Candidatus Symbiobacter mobilis CR]|uniref:Iron complex transporter ATP-binding protein n=2 Tax=Candidatus Symbiobacter TaxID=1436289 RepID=U5N4P9_9BURK|nr:iron complex transporter ATP-binding protein [Candidatus Symbiobacter mobilis CR]
MAIEGMECRRGSRIILQGVHLTIPAGQWTVIVGRNGAGKSTLLRVLAGLLPYRGQVQLRGEELRDIPDRERALRLSWMGQDEPIPLAMHAYDVVMLGRTPYIGWWSVPTAADREAVEMAMCATQTWEWRDKGMYALSRGEQQRVLLARVQAAGTDLVLLDEPLVHLDHHQQRRWIQWVESLVARGVSVVSVLHELSVALRSHSMIVLGAGQVLHSGASAARSTHQALEAAFDGEIRVQRCDGRLAALLD